MKTMMRPTFLLRLEGFVIAGLAVWAYAEMGSSWLIFAVLFLFPDLSMIGYFMGTKSGAMTYNVVHTYAMALIPAAIGIGMEQSLATSLGLIWVAHIGVDRALGFGLKYEDAFGHTHLGDLT